MGSFISLPTRSQGRKILEMAKENKLKLSETTMEGRPVAMRWDALSPEEREQLLFMLSQRGMSAFALNWIHTLNERWERRAVFILVFQILFAGLCMGLYWFNVLGVLIPSVSWLNFVFPVTACLTMILALRTMGRLEAKNSSDEEERRLCRYDWLSLKIVEAALSCAETIETSEISASDVAENQDIL